jgi:small-conductance mechanosensitive channel
MFAQWSILSNITSGILFFSFPFKIDIIRIHDKDFPIVAEIEDIRAFHVALKTKEGEMIIYPNNFFKRYFNNETSF